MGETIAEKNARLRALREARDGTPEQRRALRKAAEARLDALRLARLDRTMAEARRFMASHKQGTAAEASALLSICLSALKS